MKPYKFFMMLGLLALACEIPAIITPTPESVPTPIHINTPVPQATVRTATVTASEAVHVRAEADPGADVLGYLYHGQVVSVFLPCVVSWDMGVWVWTVAVLPDGEKLEGYVNVRFLSDGVCE